MTDVPVELKRFSPSKLTTADICLKRLEFQMADGTYHASESSVIGTGYHAGLAAYYNSRNMTEIRAAAVEAFDAEIAKSEPFEWDTDRVKALKKMLGLVDIYFKQQHFWPEVGYSVVAVEEKLRLPLAEGWLGTTVIDLVVEQESTGWHIVTDHKTARRPWGKDRHSHRKQVQPAWYTDAWSRTHPDVPGVAFCYDIMSFGGKFERRPVEVLPEHVTGTFRKVHDIIRLVDAGGPFPPNTQSSLCSSDFCDYWNICPWGAAFDG